MPAKSSSQQRLMNAVAHNPAFAKKVGISQKVGREFVGMAKGGFVPGTIPKVEDALRRSLEEAPAPAADPTVGQSKALGPRTKEERFKPVPEKFRKQVGYASGGSIDGCAQRGKTRIKRS